MKNHKGLILVTTIVIIIMLCFLCKLAYTPQLI